MEFIKDMFAFLGNALVFLVTAVFAAALLMEAAVWLNKSS